MKNLLKIFSRVCLGADMTAGLLLFVFMTNIAMSGQWSWGLLALSVFSTHAPDLDFLPYLVIKSKMKYKSHRLLGHHPVFVLPTAGMVGWFAGVYFGFNPGIGLETALIGCSWHFIHDTHDCQGFHWFSPFWWGSAKYWNGYFAIVSSKDTWRMIEENSERRKKLQSTGANEITSRLESLSNMEVLFGVSAWACLGAIFTRSIL